MTTAETAPTPQGLLANLENLWAGIDEMLGSLGPNDWSRQHGPDWTFADVPYHLSYFDQELIVTAIDRGPDVPEAEQHVWRDFNELNAWNVEMFARRPAGQTPQQSLEAMQATREALRRVVGPMSDADLDRPIFTPLFGAWINAGAMLMACGGHTWNHHTELQLRLERTEPQPSAAAVQTSLGFYNTLAPHIMLDREQAASRQLTVVMEYTGPGGGAWPCRVAGGGFTVSEGRAEQPDLVITQSTDTFVKTWIGMADPAALMQSGEIQMQGSPESMEAYGALFQPPDPSKAIPPMGAASL